jgi:hypothetical protein
MNLRFSETTAAHIYAIVSDPSEVTAGEILRSGSTKWNLIRDLCQILPDSKAVTLFADDEPIFVFGHVRSDAKHHRLTWFAAKQRYYALGARGVLAARKYLKTVKAAWPKTTFDSYSFSDHPGCERWFKLLGFERTWPIDIPANCRVFSFSTDRKR